MTTLQVSPKLGVLRNVVALGRPKFLIVGLMMHAVGAAAARATTGHFDLRLFVAAQLAVTGLQLATHYCNEFFDLQVDRLNATFTRWTGGSRVLVEERLPPATALFVALSLVACLVGGLACAWWARAQLVPNVPTVCWVLALVALVLAWEYSAPPLRLSRRGLGEAVVASIVCVILPMVGFFLQGGAPKLELGLALLPLFGIQYARIMMFNIPDARGDEAGGKRTLVVRIGVERAITVHHAIQLLSYGSLPLLALAGVDSEVLLAILATAPLAALQSWRLQRGVWRDVRSFNRLVATSTFHFLSVATAALIGFLV